MSEIKTSAEATNYNYGEITTPYQQMGQRFDHPIGAWREKAALWRVGTLISLVLSSLILILFVLQIYQPQHSILAVQITPNGFVRTASLLTDEYTIPEKISQKFIQTYITHFFSAEGLEKLRQEDKNFILSFSADAVKKNYLDLLENQLTAGVESPLTVSDVNLVAPNTYQATWSRGLKDAVTGKVVEYEKYSGTFVVRFEAPDDPSLISQNPLGFYVEKATWEKEMPMSNKSDKSDKSDKSKESQSAQ